MRYMLIHYIDDALLNSEADEDPAETQEREAWDAEMAKRGILIGGGVLRPPRETTTVRVRNGEVLVVDGPFAETKEQIAGYSMLECADLAEAIEVSSRHPTVRYGTFELRPYWD
jgi:hypothetical protein